MRIQSGLVFLVCSADAINVDRMGIRCTSIAQCRQALRNADLPYDTRYSVLMDSKHPVSELIVRDYHEKVKHSGVRETLTQLLIRFWIIIGRSFVCKVIQCYMICYKLAGITHKLPPSLPLPEFRAKEAPPFSYTGLDLLGHFL